jgi:YVTN family beta-propeller protein
VAGGVGASINVGGTPYSAAYDPANGWVYITDKSAGVVTVLNGTGQTNVTVGASPEGAVYDAGNGYVYVDNEGGSSSKGNVTVLNGTKVVAWISSGGFDGPYQGAYDPSNGLVYVANVNGNTLSILNGTTVQATLTVGKYPAGVAYDPANHDVYVSNTASVANGGSNLTIVHNTSIITTLSGNFTNPIGEAYDSTNGYLYVADKNLSNLAGAYVTVVDNQTVVGKISVGQDLFGIVYDSRNKFVYAISSSQDIAPANYDNVTVLDNLTVDSWFLAGQESYFGVYDPQNGYLYVADGYSGTVAVVTNYLSEGNLSANPTGHPNGTADTGSTQHFNATLFYPGDPPDTLKVSTEPANGLGCGTPTLSSKGFLAKNVSVACVPTAAGNYTLWLNVTDNDSSTVWARGTWEVIAHPVVANPEANRSDVDVGMSVRFNASASGGSGNLSYQWTGLPSSCTGLQTPVANCTMPTPGNVSADVIVTDSNGYRAKPARPVTVEVWSPPSDLSILTNRTTIDVGEWVGFSVSESGIAPPVGVVWAGLPTSGCRGTNTSTPSCLALAPGMITPNVTITDGNGETGSATAPVPVTVNPAPTAVAVRANLTELDVGQSVAFTANVTGGSGDFTYQWYGVPGTCQGATSASPTCAFTTNGSFSVGFLATDATGYTVAVPRAVNVTVSTDPTVGELTATHLLVDAGQSDQFSASTGGGAGGYAYDWTGLPPECGESAVATPRCILPTARAWTIGLSIVDGNGFRVAAAKDVEVTALTDPTAAPVTVDPSTLVLGENTTISSGGTGGDPPYTYTWSGLPSGCPTTTEAQFQCTPSRIGTFAISVNVTDSLGYSVRTNASSLAVTSPPGQNSGPQVGSGFPTLTAVVVGVAVVVALSVAALVLRSRRRREPGIAVEDEAVDAPPEPPTSAELDPETGPESWAGPADEPLEP